MEPITVLVHGALGKMGREITAAISRAPDLEVIGGVDIKATQNHLTLPGTSKKVPLSPELSSLLDTCHPQVLVDFTIAEASIAAARTAMSRGINIVIGTSGLSQDNLDEIHHLAKTNQVGAVVAPNFALGSVVLLHLAKIAAKFFDYAEIIELHHHEKADAPSGTALATAREMLKARGKPFVYPLTKKETLSGTRGGQVDGVAIHSVRLLGYMASQEVIFGAPGQTLILRHDTINRECYMPGVILAIKEVVKREGLVYGLDTLLNLR
ncbi:MAG TPA: 4-hydroxy-tetrahydrodipicolinate reductase [Dehalococcoidia bacterium]|nr:4-hydroxy-tetrahydrodipicolinate reductase [Dehalococcoidia bacterium]